VTFSFIWMILLTTATSPQTDVFLFIGTNFTATCVIQNTTEVTVDDLYWSLGLTPVPTELYTRINSTALNVTIPITRETPDWLFCSVKKSSPDVILNRSKYKHGILLQKGYLPVKPVNLSCMAVQKGAIISPVMVCEWESKQPQGGQFTTTYNLVVRVVGAEVNLSTFPHFMPMEIWVEATNELGTAESEHLNKDANSFVKTNPPSNVQVISEKTFTKSLLVNWTQPLAKVHLELTYEIRYCSDGCHQWDYVPSTEIDKNIHSFRLQDLTPYTVYITQVRCKNVHPGYGYWSEWSNNATKRTPEDRPTSKPDLWLSIDEDESNNERQVKLLVKEPKYSNGRIIRYDMKIQDLKEKDKSGADQWEKITVSEPEANSSSGHFTLLKQIHVADNTHLQVRVKAVNSVGKSPEATLVIPKKSHVLPPVRDLKVYPDWDKLMVMWNSTDPLEYEYVVEVSDGQQMDWQKEGQSVRKTAVRGYLEEFVRYNVSVYPIYRHGWIGKPARVEAYLRQGVPLDGPSVTSSKPGCFNAYLEWTDIPEHRRRGFITYYTIFYSDGNERHCTVPGNITSYTLKSLSRNTRYDVWITASTINGSVDGFNHSFHTLKYAPGEIEGIVVGVSLGFLFVVILTMLLCICKKDVIKENFWPQIPNPGESTIGNWSPDYPLKAETPNENCLSGISVLDVDVCDGKSVFEEDKASLPLKKDKYLSEEHSSGIGGSSCMSSPRQSVSDSDEGGDVADTTASTVQYSSVVASNGYKGQTPGSQSQQAVFSRSESTQPLLESEENPDTLASDGSRHCQRFPRQTNFTASEGNADFNQLEMEEQNGLRSLEFCPLVEDSEHMMPADGQSETWASAPASSYMPQLGGYRPQ
uniref:Fibronectin type-III domain-containing protein n=1 Tax=Sphaeramia orbicularis TaxID=375764 RepID=A0A673ACK2_9TELE